MESNSSTFASKGQCFSEAQEGLALLAAMEAGYSGQNRHHNYYYTHGFGVSKVSNTASLRGFYDFSPRSARFYDARYEDHQPHFLESCFLCSKQLANKDIFMYRGDTPFCSEECRQEQIDMDEAKEKNRNLSSSMKAMRNNKEQTKSTTPDNTKDYSCVIAAA